MKQERNEAMRRLVDEEGWTFQAVADHYGVTRSRAHQVVRAARLRRQRQEAKEG